MRTIRSIKNSEISINKKIANYKIDVDNPRPALDYKTVSSELDHLMLEGAKQLAVIICDKNANPTHKVTAIRTIIEYKKVIMELTKLEHEAEGLIDDIQTLKIVNG